MTQPTGDQRRRPNQASRDRARQDNVFGDVLPNVTRDELDHDPADRDADSWYRDNRPPHHDRG